MTGPEIAECLGMALSTVSGILTRIGMGKLGRSAWSPPSVMSERSGRTAAHRRQEARPHPGAVPGKRVTASSEHKNNLAHDAAGVRRKTVGWEDVHIAIDDATRLA